MDIAFECPAKNGRHTHDTDQFLRSLEWLLAQAIERSGDDTPLLDNEVDPETGEPIERIVDRQSVRNRRLPIDTDLVEVTRRLAGLPVEAPLVIRVELGLAWLGLGLLAEEGRREREDARAMFSFALELFSPAEHPAAALAAERAAALGGALAAGQVPRDPAEPPLVVYWNAAAGMGDLAHPRGGRWTVDAARAGGPLQPGARPPWDLLEGPLTPG